MKVVHAVLLVGVSLYGTEPASAEPAGADARAAIPSPVRAHELRERATRAYDLQRYAEAAGLFASAYELDARPELLYAIGQAWRLGGDCVRAVRSYEAFLRSQPPARQVAITRAQIAACRAQRMPATQPASRPHLLSPPPPSRTVPSPPRGAGMVAPSARQRTSTARSWWVDPLGGTLLLGGLALGGVGAGLYVDGHNSIQELNGSSSYGEFALAIDHARDGQTRQRIGSALLAAGGAAIVAAIVRYVWVYYRHRSTPPGTAEQSNMPRNAR